MSTTFKVGDKVKLTGEAWKDHQPGMHLKVVEVISHDEGDDPLFIFDGEEWCIYASDYSDYSATLVESAAPPPDTRKRLREYATELEVDDGVLIAGVWFRVTGKGWVGPTGDGADEAHRVSMTGPTLADMLVDEVRRKPKTKAHRIYEEVAPSEAKIGDLVTQEVLMGLAYRWNGDREKLKGCRVWRFVDETEVPR